MINSLNLKPYQNLDLAVFIKDTKSRYLWANTFFLYQSAGLQSVSELHNKRDIDFPWRDYATDLISHDNTLFENKKSITVRERIQRYDGDYVDIISKKSLLFNNEQQLIGLLGISIEIPISPLLQKLSHREKNAVILLSKGYTDKEIAKKWGISPRTVESFINNAKNKLNLHSRAELIAAIYHLSTPRDFTDPY